MATFIDAPGTSAFHKGMFGTLSNASMNYLQTQLQSLSQLGGDYGRNIYQSALQAFEAINGNSAIHAAKALLSQTADMVSEDTIKPLFTLEELQAAKPVMQGWIMTSPLLRKAWQDGRIEGYSDTYVDPEPGVEAENMLMYKRLWDGVFVPHKEQAWQYTDHGIQFSDNHDSLDIRDVANILQAQWRAESIYEEGEDDPTSQYGAKL